MNTTKIPSTVFVAIKRKQGVFKSVPIWNKVMMTLQGDTSNLENLMKELKEIKSDVDEEVNKRGYDLSEVEVVIEIKE